MGFSLKLAPGVRVRVSSHGVRAGIGPRVARVHVGTGRTGFSSGLGPFSVYGSVGGKRRHRSSGRPSGAALERQAAAARRAQAEADKVREAHRLAAIFQEITSLHRHDFLPVERPIAPMPELPDPTAVNKSPEKSALRGVGMFDRAGRVAARQDAARQHRQSSMTGGGRRRRSRRRLSRNLTGSGRGWLATTRTPCWRHWPRRSRTTRPGRPGGHRRRRALPDPAHPGRGRGSRAAASHDPGREPDAPKLPKGERSALYLLLVAGHVLVTLREAFTVAPGIDAARVIAVRRGGPDIYGRTALDCMVAGRWTRTAFNGVRWADVDAGNILAGTATELVLNEKRGQILPVDLSTEPEIRDLLSTMDTTDPATED